MGRARAKKLPSGSYRVNQYIGKDAAGKRKYKSFTAETPEEAEYMARAYMLEKDRKSKPENLTVGEAIDRYIESKDAVLSPATVNGYRKIRKNNMQSLMFVRFGVLTQEHVQAAINGESKTHSPKTVRNMHGLLSATLRQYYPDFTLNTSLPQKDKPTIYIPTDDDINAVLDYTITKDRKLRRAILLGGCAGLRRSEIAALRPDKVYPDRNQIEVSSAMVYTKDNEWVIKRPKSIAGNRVLTVAPFVMEALTECEEGEEFVVGLNPTTITNRFRRALEKLNIPHFRFHDLRHYNASIMLALNIPDKYAMERMGHATNNMLKNVYQHTMEAKRTETADTLNAYLEGKMQHEKQHEEKYMPLRLVK